MVLPSSSSSSPPASLVGVVITYKHLKNLKGQMPENTADRHILISRHLDRLLMREHQPRQPHPRRRGKQQPCGRKELGAWWEDARNGVASCVSAHLQGEVDPGHQRHALTSLFCFLLLLLLFLSLLYTHHFVSPPQLSSALLFDAVYAVVTAVQELNRSQEIGVKPLSCGSAQIWQHGTSLMNYLRMVSGGGDPAGHAQPARGGGGQSITVYPQYITAMGKTMLCGDPIQGTVSPSCP